MKGEEAIASAVGSDGPMVGIPGFANGYVIVASNKIPLRLDRPPILIRSGIIDLSDTAITNFGQFYLPFKGLIVAARAIVTTTLNGAGKLRLGSRTSETTYLNDYDIPTTTAAGTELDLQSSLVGYNATTDTAVPVPAGVCLGWAVGTAATAGAVNCTLVIVPHN